jgi:hypothetical protein
MLVVRHTLHHRDLLTVPAYVGVWDSGSRHKIMDYGFPRATDNELLIWKNLLKSKGWTEEDIAERYSGSLYVKITL